MTSIWDRNATASSNTSTPPAGFPENQEPSLVDDQFRAEMAYQTEFVHSVTAGGTADALTVTYTNVPASLTDGMELHVRASAANATTTPTLNVNSLGAKTITKAGGSALVAGDIAGANHELILRYNSSASHFELLNPAAGNVSGPASSTANDVPKFADTTGKVLSDGYTVGTSANNLVQLNSSAKLPAVDGSQLTNIPGKNPQHQIFTASGTFTPTASGTYKITVVGGGGGGGGNTALGDTHAGGGAGGATGIGWQSLTANTGYAVTIGGGGAGGANTGANGGAGTASIFAGVSTITANGGGGGQGVSTPSTSGGGGAGALATGGDINIASGEGFAGAGGSSAYGGGNGGSSSLASGATCSPGGQGDNANAAAYGAGGAGSGFGATAAAHAGGNGAPGVVIVEWIA